MKNFKVFDGNISSPIGFLASGVHCGIKEKNKDLSIIYSECPAVCSAVFTKNKVIAAPLVISKKHIEDKYAQVIVVNSGNANACTGEQGMKDAELMVELTSKKLLIPKENVIVSSTGIIGVPMPMDKVKVGIEDGVKALSKKGGLDAAQAILTTDKNMKKSKLHLKIESSDYYKNNTLKIFFVIFILTWNNVANTLVKDKNYVAKLLLNYLPT